VSITAKTNFKTNVTNFFGAFGYFCCSLQWFWVILLYSSFITGLALYMSQGADNNVVESPAVINQGSTLSMIILAVTAIIIVALTIYILIKIPSTIVKTSKNIVHKTAEDATPLILRIQHKKDNKRNHLKLTPRLILGMKVILIIAPVILSLTSQFIDKQIIDFYIAMYVSLLLAILSVIFFVFQYILASIFVINRQDIW
jgi:hypothetical protein